MSAYDPAGCADPCPLSGVRDGDGVSFPIVFPDKNSSGLKTAIEFVGFVTASQPVQELHRFAVEATKRLLLDSVSDHSADDIFGKTFGRDCAEQHAPSGAKRVDAEGPNLIDLGFDRSGVNGPLSHGLSHLTIGSRQVGLCFPSSGRDDAIDALAIKLFGLEGKAKFLPHDACKEPTHCMLLPVRGFHNGCDRCALSMPKQAQNFLLLRFRHAAWM
jgi:hypothetical protein